MSLSLLIHKLWIFFSFTALRSFKVSSASKIGQSAIAAECVLVMNSEWFSSGWMLNVASSLAVDFDLNAFAVPHQNARWQLNPTSNMMMVHLIQVHTCRESNKEIICSRVMLSCVSTEWFY